MNVIEEFTNWQNKINEAYQIVKKLEDDRIRWCRENAVIIKEIMPEKNKMYQIIELPYDFVRKVADVNDTYFFKPTNIRFDPTNLFNYGVYVYPKVKGEVYDCNFRKIDIYDPEICITQLKQIDGNVNYKDRFTYIYIMIDKNTGYYKIGRSKNPKTRERTLQSEKPTIEMLFFSEAKMSDEKTLHDKYYDKRIRGEWFDLKGSDILEIKQYFNRP